MVKAGGFGSKELCGGGDLSELLRELDDEPLGTASIAQARRLGDGRISDSLWHMWNCILWRCGGVNN